MNLAVRLMISVIGGSEAGPSALEAAERVGAEIARQGAVLVCGGLGGVMEAACRGAKREGGLTVGILPMDSHNYANKYVDIAIPTGLGHARNYLVARAGMGVIAIDGAAGTLSEMAIAWFSDRPIASVVSSGGWAEQLAGKKIDHRRRDTVYAAENPEDAVRYIVRAIRRED